MKWETVIGLETHAQLSTRSKIFSGAPTAFGAAPNTQACEVDIGAAGVLPVLIAARSSVPSASVSQSAARSVPVRFSRARITSIPTCRKATRSASTSWPIVVGGTLEIVVGDQQKTVHLTRAHLEEDAGKSLHEDFHA